MSRRRFAARPDPISRYQAPRRPALPAGQLRMRVLAHLQAHPQLDFSPTELGNVLGRTASRGAITKICRRLVEDGLAIRASVKPERYRAASA